jgi:replicative DNA helicase
MKSAICDTQAEASAIATLLFHPGFILHSEYLKPGYFYNKENGCIYWAIQELYKAGIDNIDALNLTNMLNSNKAVKRKMEEANITDLQEFILMAQYAARHTLEEYRLSVDAIVTMSFKRDLAKIAGEIQSDCYNDDYNLAKMNEIVNNKISNLTEGYITTTEIELFSEKTQRLWEKLRSQDASERLPSKFPSFSPYFKYKPGELVLLKARMKQGKSAFFLNELVDKVQHGIPTLYIDTEMDDENFYERLLAHLSGVQYGVIDENRMSNEQVAQMELCNKWIDEHPFVHIYMPDVNYDEIYSICRILKYKINLKFFIFDYIKSNKEGAAENANLLGAKTDFLKNRIAGELQLAVLSGAQLGRSGDVADSDKILRYVSTSIYWRFKTVEELASDGVECGNIIAYVDVNRNGRQMMEEEAISFDFDGDRMRITEAKQPERKPQTPFDNKDNDRS